MSKYLNVMSKKPPHVFVKYERGETHAQDRYRYGVVGSMPIAQLIGYIIRVQAELAFRNPEPCDEDACVIAYNPETNKFQWFVNSRVPVDALVGSLELIKCQLVDSQMAALALAMQQRQQTGLIAPDGRPIIKKEVLGGS